MTCRRDPDSWQGRVWAVARLLGPERAAAAAGVTASRLRQLSNPNRRDAEVLETLLRLDAEAAAAGFGTPLLDLWRERLARAGVDAEAEAETRARGLARAGRLALAALRGAVDILEAALAAPRGVAA